jgi:hypothetical protein
VVFVLGGLSAYEESLQGLAAITQLHELAVEMTENNLTVGSLLPLTSLTALTSLSCEWEASADPMAPAGADPTAAVEDTRVTFKSQVNSRLLLFFYGLGGGRGKLLAALLGRTLQQYWRTHTNAL